MSARDSLPAVYMRGGTSKGVFLHEGDLPDAGPKRDQVLLDLLGSPDPMQIDGMGGTYSSTSKAVLVSAVDDEVRYWFAQIGVDTPIVDWNGNCGNLTTAVGPFAIDEGLVPAVEPVTTVPLRNMNTGVRITAQVPVENGRAKVRGEQSVPGVPHTGAPIATDYLDPAGKVLGAALPTGSRTDLLEVAGVTGDTTLGTIRASIVDITHPYLFVRAGDLGVDLDPASRDELNSDPAALTRFEKVRATGAVQLGLVAEWTDAATVSATVPRLVLVDGPGDTADDTADPADLRALGISMGQVHHALQMTGALAVAAAARIPGTVVHEVAKPQSDADSVRVRHPKGVVTVRSDVDASGESVAVRSVGVVRTARRLMSGQVHLREPLP